MIAVSNSSTQNKRRQNMNDTTKKLALVTAMILGFAATSPAMAHQYKHKQSHGHHAAKHYKHHHYKAGRHHGHRPHHRHYGYRYAPSSYVGLNYYFDPYGYDDSLGVILRYHAYD
jgi:hypothetical protein